MVADLALHELSSESWPHCIRGAPCDFLASDSAPEYISIHKNPSGTVCKPLLSMHAEESMKDGRPATALARKPRGKNLIPGEFNNAQQPGQFWDIYSASDYADQMTEANIPRLTFLVPAADRISRPAESHGKDRSSPIEEQKVNG